MDRFCWFCGQKVKSFGFTSECPNGHIWHTDGADTPDDPLVIIYGWEEEESADEQAVVA